MAQRKIRPRREVGGPPAELASAYRGRFDALITKAWQQQVDGAFDAFERALFSKPGADVVVTVQERAPDPDRFVKGLERVAKRAKPPATPAPTAAPSKERRRIGPTPPDGMRFCPKCKAAKPLDDYNRASDRLDGRQGNCRECRGVTRPRKPVEADDEEHPAPVENAAEAAVQAAPLEFLRVDARLFQETPLRLTHEETVKLYRQWKRKGDRVALNRIIRGHKRWVQRVALRYGPIHGGDYADNVQAGLLGLMRALKDWDPKRGHLTTYSANWIRSYVTRHGQDHGADVRIPVHLLDRQHQIRKAFARLAGVLGRHPTREELAEAVGMKPAKLDRALESLLARKSVSLDIPMRGPKDEEGKPLGEILPSAAPTPEDELGAAEVDLNRRRIIEQAMERLDPREAEIIRARYLNDDDRRHTLGEIGDGFYVSRERIRQIEQKALEKLRRALKPSRKELVS